MYHFTVNFTGKHIWTYRNPLLEEKMAGVSKRDTVQVEKFISIAMKSQVEISSRGKKSTLILILLYVQYDCTI